jgi:hypothetical protein
MLERQGHYAHHRYGVTLRTGDEALHSYITKASTWSLGDELAKANRKQGRAGRTPVQLLADAGGGDAGARELYREYAAFTFRKNQLGWSKNLRKLLGMDAEQTDSEVVEEAHQEARLVLVLNNEQWWVVLVNKARADLLVELEADGGRPDRVINYLAQLGVDVEPWQIHDGAEWRIAPVAAGAAAHI